jgi:hypothetical protein
VKSPSTTEASTSTPSLLPPPVSSCPASQDDELVRKKKALVDSLDQIVEPLDAILALMRNAWRGGVLLLAFMALMIGVQVHTTLRMLTVEEQLNDIIAAQKTLQQTATTVADKQTATQNVLNQQSQITIEPSVTPDGATTAIVVVKPPPAASQLPAIPLPLAPPALANSITALPVSSKAGATPGRQPHVPAAATATAATTMTVDANAPPPAPAAPIKFE